MKLTLSLGRDVKAICCLVVLFPFGCAESPTNRDSTNDATPIDTTQVMPAAFVRTDWPRMSGPLSNHSSPETQLDWSWGGDGPGKLWSKPCGSGYSMPIVANGTVYILGREANRTTLVARSVQDGSESWRWNDEPAKYTDEFETYSDGSYSTPCIAGDHLYLITGDGILVDLITETGVQQRKLDLLGEFDAPVGPFPWGTSLLVIEPDGVEQQRRLVINVGGANNSGMVCINASDFSTVWTGTSEGRSYASPRLAMIGDRQVIIQLTQRNVVALEANSGQLLWSTKFGGRGDPTRRANSVSPLLIPGEPTRAFITAGPGVGLLRVTMESIDHIESELFGSEKNRTLDSQFNNLVTDGQRLYGFTSKWNRQAQFRCIDMETGDVLWSWDSVLQRGGSVFVDNRILALGEDGHLAAISATSVGPRILAMTTSPVIEGPCYSAPVIAGGRLFIRTEREVACFRLGDDTDSGDLTTSLNDVDSLSRHETMDSRNDN